MSVKIGNEASYKNKHTKPKCAIAAIATILPLKLIEFLCKNNNAMFMFLFLIIGISILSLSVSTIMINAKTFSDGFSGSGTSGTPMGVCVIGIRSPCNGPSN
jgi:hypothetical protein